MFVLLVYECMCAVYTYVCTDAHAYKPEDIQCSALSVPDPHHSLETWSHTKPEAGPASSTHQGSCLMSSSPIALGPQGALPGHAQFFFNVDAGDPDSGSYM